MNKRFFILAVVISLCASEEDRWFENSIVNLVFYAEKLLNGEGYTIDDIILSPSKVEVAPNEHAVRADTNPFVQTTSGVVEGITTTNSHAFYEIPYAVPPVGDLRFKSPLPLDTPGDSIDGTTNRGKMCEQFRSDCLPVCPPFVNMDEDCLILNVFVPLTANLSDNTSPPEASMDVLYYVHGGSFLHGRSTSSSINGEWLAKETGHIVVTVNYRLAAWGFLSLKEGDNEISGKQGVEDMILSLKWVHDNIASFGGNRDSVTIFGNSAGAQACMLLLLDEESDPYFHRVIMQSNPAIFPYPTQEEAQIITNRQTRFMGCNETESQYDCLMNATPGNINNQELKLMLSSLLQRDVWNMVEPYRPVMGFTDQPLALFRDGIWQNHKQVIIGTNTGECDHVQEVLKLFPLGFSEPAYRLVNAIFMGSRELGNLVTDQYIEWYDGDDGYARASTEQMTHAWFVCPSRAMARFASDTTAPGGNVFLYSFSHPREGEVCVNSTDNRCGYSTHAAEVKFVFRSGPSTGYEFSADDWSVADQFSSYWGKHASYGDPSSELGFSNSFMDWPIYEEDGNSQWTNIQIDAPDNIQQQGYLDEVCDFWDSLDFYVEMSPSDDTTTSSTTTSTTKSTTTQSTTSTTESTTDSAEKLSMSIIPVTIFTLYVNLFQ